VLQMRMRNRGSRSVRTPRYSRNHARNRYGAPLASGRRRAPGEFTAGLAPLGSLRRHASPGETRAVTAPYGPLQVNSLSHLRLGVRGRQCQWPHPGPAPRITGMRLGPSSS
jgi:hypothetical protein